MTIAAEKDHDLQWFGEQLRQHANALYATTNLRRILEIQFTRERMRVYALQMKFWLTNRRDCWGFAQGLAPEDVKAMIWEDELGGNAERGVEDHGSLHVRESRLFGLTTDDFSNVRIAPPTRTATYAWIHLVKDSPWLKAVSACAALEISNSSEWVTDGGLGYRLGKKLERDLGIPYEKQVNLKEHAEVDVDHAHMLMQIAKRYGTTPGALELMLEGADESWDLFDTWIGLVVDMMERFAGPSATS